MKEGTTKQGKTVERSERQILGIQLVTSRLLLVTYHVA